MTNEIVSYKVSDMQVMAEAVARSNLFGIKSADQALALMLIAQAEGLHPAIAARDYHIINGKPALKADAMLARFQTAGGSMKWGKYTDSAVSAIISHPQGGSVEIEWTIEMANRAGLTKNPTWKQYPRQMLRARVISEGIRTVFPGVAVGVYTPEEVSDFDTKPPRDMGTVEREPEQQKSLPPYPQDQFDINFPKWVDLILAGKKSASDIIALVSTKGILSQQQRDAILDAEHPDAVIENTVYEDQE